MAFLEVKGIKKSFGETEVLKGIDFNLEKGKVLSIIGSSGSGKTTLLRCMNYLEEADEGTITLGGETIFEGGKAYGEKELRNKRLRFGLVFQSFNLFPQYNVLGNVTLALNLAKKEEIKSSALPRAEKKKLLRDAESDNEAYAMEIIERVGLTEKAKNYPCELSGGQQQRVAIARAMALKPDVLCFDEPTSALDPELTGEVLKVIKNLKTGDRTMIIVTHEMEFARAVSDKVIYMSDGKIEEEGNPEQVFGTPKSEKLKNFLAARGDNE